MIFDITDLDKIQVLQALYANGNPKGYGEIEWSMKDVHGLSTKEAQRIFNHSQSIYDFSNGSHDIDYVNGVPIKWESKIVKGRYLLYPSGYDLRHGNYKAFDILYKTFMHDEFSIVRKGFGSSIVTGERPEKDEDYSIERKAKYSKILKQTTRKVMPYGIRWFLPVDPK